MSDPNYHRRNKIAALLTHHYGEIAKQIAESATGPGEVGVIPAVTVFGTYESILAALAGETSLTALKVPEVSMLALQITTLTEEPRK